MTSLQRFSTAATCCHDRPTLRAYISTFYIYIKLCFSTFWAASRPWNFSLTIRISVQQLRTKATSLTLSGLWMHCMPMPDPLSKNWSWSFRMTRHPSSEAFSLSITWESLTSSPAACCRLSPSAIRKRRVWIWVSNDLTLEGNALAAMNNYGTAPRPLLRWNDPVQIKSTVLNVPTSNRHDSNEKVFSASTGNSRHAGSDSNCTGYLLLGGFCMMVIEQWNEKRGERL